MKANSETLCKNETEILAWLCQGDPAIVYQVKRDLMGFAEQDLIIQRNEMLKSGYVKHYLDLRDPENGKWANGIYSPKWASTHYTMLELLNLEIPPQTPAYVESAHLLLDQLWRNQKRQGQILYQDMCVTGMLGSMVCHAKIQDPRLNQMVDYMLDHVQSDGGFNCNWNTSKVSSIMTTLTMLIFIRDYIKNGYVYRASDLEAVAIGAQQYILERHLYKRKSTGEGIQKAFVNLPYPTRYKYDILKCLDYFQSIDYPYDPRMADALALLKSKQLKDGTWPSTGNYTGVIHFKMSDDGRGSRINTLRALRVLKAYGEAGGLPC